MAVAAASGGKRWQAAGPEKKRALMTLSVFGRRATGVGEGLSVKF